MEYFTFIGREISALSVEEIRSNACIQSNAIAKSFANRFDNLSGNLAIISSAPLVKEGDVERAKQILNAAQQQTAEVTGAYVWLDSNGNVLWTTRCAGARGAEPDQQAVFHGVENREPSRRAPPPPLVICLEGCHLPGGAVSPEFSGVISITFSLESLGKILESEL